MPCGNLVLPLFTCSCYRDTNGLAPPMSKGCMIAHPPCTHFFKCCNLTVPLFRRLATETRTRRSKDCQNAAKKTPHINCTPPAHEPHIKRSSKRRLLCTSIPGNTIEKKRTQGTIAALTVRFPHLPVTLGSPPDKKSTDCCRDTTWCSSSIIARSLARTSLDSHAES